MFFEDDEIFTGGMINATDALTGGDHLMNATDALTDGDHLMNATDALTDGDHLMNATDALTDGNDPLWTNDETQPIQDDIFSSHDDNFSSHDDNIITSPITNAGYEPSFTGLIDNGLANCEAYKNWEDGVEPQEITPEAVTEISQHIVETFGKVCPVVLETDLADNMAMLQVSNGIIMYNEDFTETMGNDYGANALVGGIAHEIGHNITKQTFEDTGVQLSSWQNELCADYIAGMVLGLANLSPDELNNWYTNEADGSPSHPNGELRVEAATKGYEWASNPLNHTFAEFTLQNLGMLRDQMMADVIVPYSDCNYETYTAAAF